MYTWEGFILGQILNLKSCAYWGSVKILSFSYFAFSHQTRLDDDVFSVMAFNFIFEWSFVSFHGNDRWKHFFISCLGANLIICWRVNKFSQIIYIHIIPSVFFSKKLSVLLEVDDLPNLWNYPSFNCWAEFRKMLVFWF